MDLIRKTTKIILATGLICFAATGMALSQSSSTTEEANEGIQDLLKNDYFSFGMLAQGLAAYQPDAPAGADVFSVTKARFKMSGQVHEQFGYKLQATILGSSPLIDANVYYKPTANSTIRVGQFKSPFSYEYATGAGSIPFISRSTVVNTLDPKRELGLQFHTKTSSDRFSIKGGIFNGDVDGLKYIGGVEAKLLSNNTSSAKIGANLAYESDGWFTPANSIQAERTLAGSHLVLSQGNLSLVGEFIYSWLKPEFGQEQNPYGYYATLGYSINPKSKVRLRWDAFNGDDILAGYDSESLVAGFNHSPNKFTKFKFNYMLPVNGEFGDSRFMGMLQIGF